MVEVTSQVLLLEAYVKHPFWKTILLKNFKMFIPFNHVITFLGVCPKERARNSDRVIFNTVIVCIRENLKIN